MGTHLLNLSRRFYVWKNIHSLKKTLLDPYLILFCLVLAKICPTRIPEFIRPEKNRVRTRIFVRILNPDIKFYTFLLSEPDFDPNLPSSEMSDPEKTGYRTSISRPNFDIVRIVRPEFDPNPNFCQRYLCLVD